MAVPDYTTVVGVDSKHLRQLALVWPNWVKYKPSLLLHPMIVFYDRDQVNLGEVRDAVDHPDLDFVPWPDAGVTYRGDGRIDKWSDPQRYKMLAGFVYVPALYVKTDYWLKLDTDTVATGQDDWIDERWFDDSPAIVSHRWGYTKPANQMLELDAWVERNRNKMPVLAAKEPLNLAPRPGSSRVGHKRIISWCSFFNTQFTWDNAEALRRTCGRQQLPVPSQDGFTWYMAKRMGLEIVRTNMKSRGWKHCSNERNIRKAIKELENDGVTNAET